MSEKEVYFGRAVNYDDALWRAAAESAVETSYWDIFGSQHHIDRDALSAILRALGWDTGSFESIERERYRRFAANARRALPETQVISQNHKSVPVSFESARASGAICYEIRLENGQALAGSIDLAGLQVTSTSVLDDSRWSAYCLPLPAELPLGYHSLAVTVDGESTGTCRLIVCPDRCYLPEDLANGGKTAGFNVALYGLRSGRNWGCGDFTDLRKLLDWAHNEVGFSFVGLNPLHALHNRAPYNTSPYLPLSMYYKNLIYIDIESVREFQNSSCAQSLFRSDPIQTKIRQLRDAPFVEYTAVDRLKRRFLKLLYREFHRNRASHGQRAKQFDAYREREGELLARFSLYCALDEVLHKRDRNLWTWRDWPAHFQNPNSPESRQFGQDHTRLVEFYSYIQFVLEEQLAAAQKYALDCGMSIGLYHDLAVATDNYGADLWATGDHYVSGCRVGAPPDDFSPGGQDWGFPPPNKEAHRADGFHLYRESISKIVRFGGALRIDHVMRLYRLFWVPLGMSPARGAYVRDYAEDLMHVLALESVRSRNIIIGEDLGTVTDEMRALFTRFGILSYRLFPFEKNYATGEFKHSFEYPRQALVSSSTHDLPTMAGFWQSCDAQLRLRAGLVDESGYRNQLEDRKREKQRMLDRLQSEGLLPPSYTHDAAGLNDLDGDLHNATVGFLSQVPSLILLLNQEDLTKESQQQNLPGSTGQYPNWQRKMRVPIEELTVSGTVASGAMLKHQLIRTGRSRL